MKHVIYGAFAVRRKLRRDSHGRNQSGSNEFIDPVPLDKYRTVMDEWSQTLALGPVYPFQLSP